MNYWEMKTFCVLKNPHPHHSTMKPQMSKIDAQQIMT